MVVRLLALMLSCKEILDHAIAECFDWCKESRVKVFAVRKGSRRQRNKMESTHSEATCLR